MDIYHDKKLSTEKKKKKKKNKKNAKFKIFDFWR